jgi:hypothetical protein
MENMSENEQRTQFWCDAWLAVAGSANCISKDSATSWADKALEDYDARFTPVITVDESASKDLVTVRLTRFDFPRGESTNDKMEPY